MSMQEELRRCNYFGDMSSVFEVAKLAIVDHETDIDSVNSICMLNTSLNVKPKICVLFFYEIGLVSLENEMILANKLGLELVSKGLNEFARRTAELSFNYLIDNEIVDLDSISIDTNTSKCLIKKSSFPLFAAVFRNYLLDSGMMSDYSSTLYEIQDEYEAFFEESIKLRKSVLTLEKMKDLQEKQAEQGRMAEEFVVKFERKRLKGHRYNEKIKQISDFDVSAGFDVLSYESMNSVKYDRFIEVKSYRNQPHFYWSANEYHNAQLKGMNYYLYLVDIERYKDEDYEPIIIGNPADILMKDENWIIETASFEITHV